ncbi:hypothetical protein KY348_03200 [Candidatus Woesearchaeota archaeon]|nr:hypothetical protein [Candidatus Woesearchaeota archaeon]
MKKGILALAIGLMLVMSVIVVAKPVKEFYDGKTTPGNSAFTNIVDDNFCGSYPCAEQTVTGWVRYGKAGKCLHTTWVVNGLEPETEYQLKLQTKSYKTQTPTGDIVVCEYPDMWVTCGSGMCFECGYIGGGAGSPEDFLVMDFAMSDEDGHISWGTTECRLDPGEYTSMQFLVTENGGDWSSAWTWEQEDSQIGSWLSSFTIKE